MITQACPNCHAVHDIGVYVSGQRILCRCGIRFEVKRTDVSGARSRSDLTTLARPPREGNSSAGPPSEAPVTLELEQATARDEESTLLRPRTADPERTISGEVARTFISAPAPTMQIPGFELLEVLGRGGMGEVWRARQNSLGRTVAIKVLPSRLAQDPEFVARFEKESTALAALNHPNVIQIIDRGVAGECAYFVMELVQGRSLREVMNAGRLSLVDVLKLATQISKAIDYAHEQGIIHRDLKPENILVDERGHVKVADFGLAGFRGPEEKPSITATRVAMGTLNYMAPEQRRDARSVDGRADIYSLGVILYELLTGELPIGRFKLPSERDPTLDRRLDEIISRALEPEPDARFPRAAEVAAVLDALLPTSSSTPLAAGASGWTAPRPVTAPAQAAVPTEARSLIRSGFSGLKVGLMVVGTFSIILVIVKGPCSTLPDAGPAKAVVARPVREFPPNTDGDLFTAITEAPGPNGQLSLTASFAPGPQELNAHAGDWKVQNGKLVVLQAGNETKKEKLVPRTYLAGRYFSSDDLTLEAEMSYQETDYDALLEEGHQHFVELAFRLKGLQVSVFAIPEVGMRLLWRYTGPDGNEVVGNSARELDSLAYDEQPVPPPGEPFRVKLSFRKQKGGTLVEAFINGERFARKVLPGFSGRVGKVAVGCRNLRCEFDELHVTGSVAKRPTQVAGRPQ